MAEASFADMVAANAITDKNGSNGMFGGENSIWMVLILLFFLGRGGGLLGTNGTTGGTSEAGVEVLQKLDQNQVLAAIQGNATAIQILSEKLGTETATLQSALCATNNAIQQAAAQTNMSICQLGHAVTTGNMQIISTLQSCCCDMKTQMLAQFATTNSNITQGFGALNTTIQVGNLNTINAIQNSTCTLVNAGNANTQKIVDILGQNKYDELQNKYAELTASCSKNEIIAAVKNCCCPQTSCGC